MPAPPDPRIIRATQSFQRGDFRETESDCRRILESDPRSADALHLLGLVAIRAGQPAAAVELIGRAIEIDPHVSRYYTNRGDAQRALGRLEEARSDQAHAISIDPANATAHYNMGIVLRALNRLDDSIASYRQAVRIKPEYARAHYNLANALRVRGELDEAEAAYRAAISLNPNHAEAWNNLGELLSERMRIDESLAALDRAIALKPDHATARYNRGFVHLLRGEYRSGWEGYDWRFRMPALLPHAPKFSQPRWDGSDLTGKTILLLGEQGVGDNIQFARYATPLAARGGQVILGCQKSVAALLATIPGVKRVVSESDPLPPFDTWIPMLSVPALLGTTLENIPATVPYIFPDQRKVDEWKSTLAPQRAALNIGLAWAGNPNQANDRNRSANLAALKPFAGIANTKIFSLQKGAASEQIAQASFPLVDLTEKLSDFSDTAALIANLDVVISVCTSVAHVAGAMGKPTLTMLCFNADWRWLMQRGDSPWYPTMKLFRQAIQGDWESVSLRVRQELEARLHAP
ncbi:tetratricopeptide repeat protein [soil metagenome]